MDELVVACATGLVTPRSAAEAANDRCATKGKFRQVQKGTSPLR